MTKTLIRLLAFLFTLLSISAHAQHILDYPLGPGDIVRIQVFQNPDLTTETRVS
jgi:polysaccharide export outer membrane protein